MYNFTFHNPTKVLFGKGQIASLAEQIPPEARILLTYGRGSIKTNGVYEAVMAALKGRQVQEFGGIEANPRYETLMPAVELCRAQKVDFLLAVGGGSVLDGTKFIAAAVPFNADPWDILAKHAAVHSALPIGAVLTLPATGSESNGFAVINRDQTREKLAFGSPHCYPRFSVLDPETTRSLPPRQVANGIVDAYSHVLEQYLTYPADGLVQDRLAEAVLLSLIDVAPKALTDTFDYQARANFFWATTVALNGLLGAGVPQDWSTHIIGHELTALYEIDHARTLAAVFPANMQHRRQAKRTKLLQYAERVWGLTHSDEDARIDAAINRTRSFFESLGVPTRLSAYDHVAADTPTLVEQRLLARGQKNFGERGDLDPAGARAILELAMV